MSVVFRVYGPKDLTFSSVLCPASGFCCPNTLIWRWLLFTSLGTRGCDQGRNEDEVVCAKYFFPFAVVVLSVFVGGDFSPPSFAILYPTAS